MAKKQRRRLREEREELIAAKKGGKAVRQRTEHSGPLKTGVNFGDMKFKEVPTGKPDTAAFFSESGMTPEEMQAFAEHMHGPDAKVVGGTGKPVSAKKMAEALHASSKRVVGAQSGRDLSVEDLKQILQRQGLGLRKEPHLIDIILDGGLYNPEAAPPLGVLHQAKKFIFDSSASEYIGALLVKAQMEVLSQHQWARPPFDTTWIEMDHTAYWDRGLKLPNDNSRGAVDNLFGFLVHNGTVTLFAHAPGSHDRTRRKPTGAGPFQYQLHTPITYYEEMAMAQRFGVSLFHYRQALLGGMLDENGKPTIMPEWWDTMAKEIVQSHKMFVTPTIVTDMERATPEQRFQVLAAGAGDLKLVITLLLMVTRPRKMFTVADIGPKRVLYKGHNMVRRAHSVVTMRLAKEKALHHAVTHEFTSVHRQMHDVRGHWAESRHNAMCQEHSWEPIDKDHFYCLNCPAKRWWRKAHTRGELRLGDKTTDYVVKR